MHRIGLIAIAFVALAGTGRAAEPTQVPIHGADVMGDRNRTGPDGWAIAPQTRDQVAVDKPRPPGSDLNSQPGPDTGRRLAPGADPGTPVATESHGPGLVDTGAPRKP